MLYLASTESLYNLLLLAETPVHEKWLPVETVSVIVLRAEIVDSLNGSQI